VASDPKRAEAPLDEDMPVVEGFAGVKLGVVVLGVVAAAALVILILRHSPTSRALLAHPAPATAAPATGGHLETP
jgi:hypothetical protein